MFPANCAIDTGAQPLEDAKQTVFLTANGEIYNHRQLRSLLKNPAVFQTHSDCEVIIHLYKEIGTDVVSQLDGMFSFALLDTVAQRLIVARDPIGITTLYYGKKRSQPNTMYFASEMKVLHQDCDEIEVFPPGYYYDSAYNEMIQYFNPSWWNPKSIPDTTLDYTSIRAALEAAVRKRLMAEVPYGVLLSGGLDSSLIASIACREAEKVRLEHLSESESEDVSMHALRHFPRLNSFSIGLKGSPDLVAAKEAARFLKTAHHEFTFTVQEGQDAISDVIYHLETYDVTTVRASTPMYLLSRKIKATGVKMVLSGEGSDEIFGGYLYFHSAPNAESLHEETVNRVRNLHTSDCLRANKSTMAWGLEARVPFLDKDFLDVAMTTQPHEKIPSKERMEKYILRKAFDDPSNPFLPRHILWRQKEQFSDGVGYSWIDSLRDHAEKLVTSRQWEERAMRWPVDTPQTKEAYWYRDVFEQHFPGEKCIKTVVRWIPRADWGTIFCCLFLGCPSDPSGRAQKAHNRSNQ